ncbi:MAG: hypothetical protein AAB600_01675 [Patescibacteria group bacterium]
MKIRLIILAILILPLLITINNSTSHKNIESSTRPVTVNNKKVSSEISAIVETNNLDKQVALYKKLIARVGPEAAQEELLYSGLSFDGQTHLLNHTVGDYLYDKYKTSGLAFCKDYFLSSCYHGFVIRAVADGGFDALKEVMSVCWQKGEPVAVQCSHAIGHGLLAWIGYANLTKALNDCDKLSQESKDFPLYNCHDGVFMENIWAVHENGKLSKDSWLSEDPVYPCNDPRIDSKYIQACWSNQPMRMYQMFKADLGKVGEECLKLTDNTYKITCFDGLARQIHPLTKGNAQEVFKLCSTMPSVWVDPCITSIAKAAFSVGDTTIPFKLCSQVHENSKASCFETLADIIQAYTRNNLKERKTLCDKIPNIIFRQKCT